MHCRLRVVGDFGIIDAGFLPLGDNCNELIFGGVDYARQEY